MNKKDLSTAISNMRRTEVVKILEEQGGYQCYDHEGTDDLRRTLFDDIARGILPESVLPG
jgi:hypothetical protein